MYVIHFTGELFIRDSVDYYVISTLPAGEQGFEPRSATLKAAVLPLNHSPSRSSRPKDTRVSLFNEGSFDLKTIVILYRRILSFRLSGFNSEAKGNQG